MALPVYRRALTIASLALVSGVARAEEPEMSQKSTVSAPAQKTPAQQRYGLPRNPITGGAVDTDLSKPLSLRRAVHLGLALQNSIAISKSQLDSAGARLNQARSAYLPQITPRMQYQTNMQPGGVINFGGNLIRTGSSSEVFSSGINATYNIYDSGIRETNVGSSRRGLFAAEFGLANQRQNVVLAVTESYYNALRTKELVRVQEESVKRAQTNLELIQAAVKVDTAAKSDTLQAEADLANAQVALLGAMSDLNVAQANLKNAMGVVTSEHLTLADEGIAAPDATPDRKSIEDYIKVAYQNRHDIKQQQEQVNVQGYQVRSAQINNGLVVNANVTQGYQLDPNIGENRTFTVSFTYPLFDGGNTRAAIRENKASLEQARRSLDQLEQSVRLNVEQAWLVREISRQRIVAARAAQRAGELNLTAAQERQKNGLINVLELINAQVQLVNAQVSYVQAVYDYYIAEARLQRNIGLNDPEYAPRVPGVKPVRMSLGEDSAKTAFAGKPSLLTGNAPAGDLATSNDGRKP